MQLEFADLGILRDIEDDLAHDAVPGIDLVEKGVPFVAKVDPGRPISRELSVRRVEALLTARVQQLRGDAYRNLQVNRNYQ